MSKLIEFSVSPRAWAFDLWGNGHTLETDPSRQGWRKAHAGRCPETVLVGRRGVAGCFSARPYLGNQVDIAVYDETPEEVAAAWAKGESLDAYYVQMPLISGWGLVALEFVYARAL